MPKCFHGIITCTGKINLEASQAMKSGKASDKLSTGNGTVSGKGFGNAKSAMKSKKDTGHWWFNLPFVLVCPETPSCAHFLYFYWLGITVI